MSVAESDHILERLTRLHPKKIDLVLDRIRRLLATLDHPEARLPPVIHVAGTNGKGSTCAFFRAILEAAGLRVQVYSSPHLVRFRERIRLAEGMIGENELAALLEECERANAGQPITFFEITTAAAFLAFARHRADALVLEVGLGGRFDATNVIDRPKLAVITPVGLDHAEFLGTSIPGIAAEKAGIVKRGAPLIVGPQEDAAREAILKIADGMGVDARVFGQDFFVTQEHGRMVYQDRDGLLDLPLPRLFGRHQIENAAVAIAGLRCIGGDWAADAAIEQGLKSVEWPARLQRLGRGPLLEFAPPGAEIWLDGGHNPHGATAVARAMADLEERSEKPLYLVAGMLNTKDAMGFFAAFKGLARHVVTVEIPGEAASLGAGALYDRARAAGLDAAPADDIEDALMQIDAHARANSDEAPPRILICGSLHLAGVVLRENG
jgi:dihydrofolate synthase / folylpolyglutamate synthase